MDNYSRLCQEKACWPSPGVWGAMSAMSQRRVLHFLHEKKTSTRLPRSYSEEEEEEEESTSCCCSVTASLIMALLSSCQNSQKLCNGMDFILFLGADF